MMTPREELWKTLEELSDEQFKKFKWFLKDKDIAGGFPAIPVARLEGADRQDTVDEMVQVYGCDGARNKTLMVLKKISRNDLVQHLSETSLKNSRPKISGLRNVISVSPGSEYERKKSRLGKMQVEIKLLIEERQKKIQEIKNSAELSRKSAKRQVEDVSQVIDALLRSIHKSRTNLLKAIEEMQITTQNQLEGYVRELEKEISELKKRSVEVEQLSTSKNQSDFLQRFSSLDGIPPTKSWTETFVRQPTYATSVMTTVNHLKEELHKEMDMFLKDTLNGIREFEVDVTLDADTAYPSLILSGDGKQVHCGELKQKLPNNPKRFNQGINVLGKQSFSSGRFYYEVQVKGKTSWDLGVVKESVSRKGSITASPNNGFWTICLRKADEYRAGDVRLTVKSHPERVGVFVDYEDASVFFYDADSAEVLHRFTNCSFTEKLHPFLSPGLHHGGQNSSPLVITSSRR